MNETPAYARAYVHPDEVSFSLKDLPAVPRPRRVLLTTPDYFDVVYVINPHMEGHVGTVDVNEARKQWERLRGTYEGIGIEALTLPGEEGLPDMVFCANQTLPFYDPETGDRGVVLSEMFMDERKPEVEHYGRFFTQRRYRVETVSEQLGGTLEGMGDALWHPGRHLLWGGHGIRTSREVYDRLAQYLGCPIFTLRLEDPGFYHLDTCLSLLDQEHALFCPAAFDADGLALLRAFIPHLIEAPEHEARELFACNAHSPDGEHVVIQRGCEATNARLREAGFTPLEVDTDEFLKAGGSVFCMKQMIW